MAHAKALQTGARACLQADIQFLRNWRGTDASLPTDPSDLTNYPSPLALSCQLLNSSGLCSTASTCVSTKACPPTPTAARSRLRPLLAPQQYNSSTVLRPAAASTSHSP